MAANYGILGLNAAFSERLFSKIHYGPLINDAKNSLSVAETLSSYLSYLETVRDLKALSPAETMHLERELITQAKDFLDNLRTLLSVGLKIANNLEASGHLPELLNAWKQAVAREKSVVVSEVWESFLEVNGFRGLFLERGVSPGTIDRMTRDIRQAGLVHSADNDMLFVHEGSSQNAVRLTWPGESANNLTIADVVGGVPMFDLVARALTDGTELPVTYVEVFSDDTRHSIDVQESMLISVLRVLRAAEQHVRQLEDVGLEAVRGGPAAILVVAAVAGILVAAASLVTVVLCWADVVENDEVCEIAHAIVTVGLILLVGGEVCKTDPVTGRRICHPIPPSVNLRGSVTANNHASLQLSVIGSM